MNNYNKIIDNYFIFDTKTYLGIKYKIVNSILVIFTTTRTITLLISEFNEKINFDVTNNKVTGKLLSESIIVKRFILKSMTKHQIYTILVMRRDKRIWNDIAEAVNRPESSVRSFISRFKSKNNVEKFIKNYEQEHGNIHSETNTERKKLVCRML